MDYKFISETELFNGISEGSIDTVFKCLCPKSNSFKKGEYILHSGDTCSEIGLVLSGSVNIERDEIQGGRTIIANIPKGHIFAEAYACSENKPLMINAVAAEKTEILFINIRKILSSCTKGCAFNSLLIKNLLCIMADKNLSLTGKMFIITPKSIREKVSAFLSLQALKNGKRDFYIPFNRQQLADYLCAERSALSAELGRMQREGLICFHKNHFIIKEPLSDSDFPEDKIF